MRIVNKFNIIQWVKPILKVNYDLVLCELSKSFEQYNEKGTLLSTTACHSSAKKAFEKVDNSITEIIKQLSMLKYINKNDWKILHNELVKFLESIYPRIQSECFEKTGFNIITEEFIKSKKYSSAILDLLIQINIENISANKRKYLFEIFKMLLSAAIGGFIGGYIKIKFFPS